MDNKEITENINVIEERVSAIYKRVEFIVELLNELNPILKQAMDKGALMLDDLDKRGISIDGLKDLGIKSLTNADKLAYLLDRTGAVVELLNELNPILKQAMDKGALMLDDLDKRGVINNAVKLMTGMMEVAEKLTPQGIENITKLLGAMTTAISSLDLREPKKVSIPRLVLSLRDENVKKTLGVLVEFSKSLCGCLYRK